MNVYAPIKPQFPLCDMQAAYFVGEQGNLPLSTTAKWYREIGIGSFDLETVETAWRRLVLRHPLLRAVISSDGAQYVLDEVKPYPLICHDLHSLDEEIRLKRHDDIRDALMALALPTDTWPQFCVQASRDETGLRLHIRLNLWMVDAVSEYILMGELLKLCHCPEAELAELTGVFQKYSAFVASERSGPAVASARAYWRDRLSTLPAGPSLPLKCAADEIKDPTFTHLVRRIEADQWSAFLVNANRHSLLPNSAVLAAYAMTLARWSRHKHFTITLLLSRRNLLGDDMASVVGNFGTTILLEINATVEQSFTAFAKKVQKQLWTDIRNVAFSGIDVGRELNMERSTPLALTAPFTFTSMQTGGVPGVEDEILDTLVHYGTRLAVPQVFLDHQLMEEPQGSVLLSWDFVDGLFHDGVITDMFSAYAELLHTLATDPEAWLARMPLRLPTRDQQLLVRYNDTSAAYRDCTLDELVSEQISARPDHPAVINGEVMLTYAELGRRADELQRQFAQLDILPGHLIGVLLGKGWRQIVAVLAITQAGGAYVPIDPDLPLLRQRQLLEQAGISVVITNDDIAATLDAPGGVVCICLDAAAPSPSGTPSRSPHRPEDLAYVIFTSGSTGVPKGVAINHRGAVNTILDINRRLGVSGDDSVLGLSSLSFDLSVYDVFGVLGVGGTLILPTVGELQSADAWATLIDCHGITVWNSAPALFGLLVDCCAPAGTLLPSLRRILLSGDWIPRSLPERAMPIAPQAAAYSLGGATEASIWSVIHGIGALDDTWTTIPYGRPLANQELYILDDRMDQCPLWTTGELYIGGIGLALEYLGDPARTSERFVTHPQSGQRLYRTGDLGRMRPDGNMEFLGREDHQIKLRGFRIELGEVEAILLQQPAVSVAIVKVLGNSDANRRLAAFVVLKQEGSTTAEALKAALAQLLPRYMVPELLYVVNALPLTGNGKIDHKALETLWLSGAASPATEEVAVEEDELDDDELSTSIRAIWGDVLAHTRVSGNASFFALGGTSLNMLQLVARIRKQIGCSLGLGDIGPNISLASLVALIRRRSLLQSSKDPVALPLSPNIGIAGPAMFCFHPVGGNAHCYMPLASRISASARVFGIQAARAAPGAIITVEELAMRYVGLILEVAPNGPFVLVGWSMGAAIAVEAARALLAMDKEVTFVAMIDPYRARRVGLNISRAEILFAFCDDLAGLSGKNFTRPAIDPADALDQPTDDALFVKVMEDLIAQGILPPDPLIDELAEVFNIFESNTRALLTYIPSPVDVDIAAFYAETGSYEDSHYLKPWRPVNESIHEHSYAADHFAIMREPIASVIAAALKQTIETRR